MIALDPKTTALVLIDLQNGILGRKLEPISVEDLVERGKALAGRFRAAGALVVLVNAAPQAEDPPRRVDEPSPLPKILPPGFIDLAPGLAGPGDLKITKKTWGAFSARQAWELGYELLIVEDATTSIALESHDHSMRRVFPRIARITDSDSLAFPPGLYRLPRGAKHHTRHFADDLPQMADVPDLDRRGDIFRRRPRLRARPVESASRDDGDLGLFARRGDRDGADGRRLRRRHEARRRHAISARRMRWTGGLDRRPGVVGVGRRGDVDRLVSVSPGRAFPRNAGAGRRRRGHRRQIQDSGWRVASAAVRRRPAFGEPYSPDHAAAVAAGHLLRPRRLVHRSPLHARNRALRGKTIAADSRPRSSP